MDYKYIEQLLSRYFEANTTLKEEQILKAFFAQDDEEIPSSLCHYKSLFTALQPHDTLGKEFDDHILCLISQSEDTVPILNKARVISLSERLRPLLRAAAVVAVILTLSTAVNQSFRDDNVWTDQDQIARYQDEMRKTAITAATTDSVILFSEGITMKTDSLIKDSLYSQSGHIE